LNQKYLLLFKFEEDQERDYHGRFAEESSAPIAGMKLGGEVQAGDKITWGRHGDVTVISIKPEDKPGSSYHNVVGVKDDGTRVKFNISGNKHYPLVNASETRASATQTVTPPVAVGSKPETNAAFEKEIKQLTKEYDKIAEQLRTSGSFSTLQERRDAADKALEITRLIGAKVTNEIERQFEESRVKAGLLERPDQKKVDELQERYYKYVQQGKRLGNAIEKIETQVKQEYRENMVKITNKVLFDALIKAGIPAENLQPYSRMLESPIITGSSYNSPLIKDAGDIVVRTLPNYATGVTTHEEVGRVSMAKLYADNEEAFRNAGITLVTASMTDYANTKEERYKTFSIVPQFDVIQALRNQEFELLTVPKEAVSQTLIDKFDKTYGAYREYQKERISAITNFKEEASVLEKQNAPLISLYAETQWKVLGSLRQLGGSGDIQAKLTGNAILGKQLFDSISQYIPKDWIDKGNSTLPQLEVVTKDTIIGRSFFRSSEQKIRLLLGGSNLNYQVSTTLHEYMHYIEHSIRDVNDVQKAFWRDRCPKQRINANVGGNKGDPDNFRIAYTGTWYGATGNEILSTGMEGLLKSPIDFGEIRPTKAVGSKSVGGSYMYGDRDFQNFIYGLIIAAGKK